MFLATIYAVGIQAAALKDDPDFAFRSSLSAAAAADCVAESLQGKRLGANIFTLRPQLSRVFEGYVVSIGPDIRITVKPTDIGSDVALYTPRFLGQISERITPCAEAVPEVPEPNSG